MVSYHLAQINIAKAVDDLESVQLQGLVERLDEINQLSDLSQGFIWRLQTDDGDATAIRIYGDPRIIVNLSVWENIEALKAFVYESVHLQLLKAKKEWFLKPNDKPRRCGGSLWDPFLRLKKVGKS